jgi:hypothetical protein
VAAFSPTSARARLRSLEKAKERVKALKRGETMTAQPMAKFLGVSWPVLRGWCDEIDGFEQSGAFERGTNGIEYTFHPRKVVTVLIKHFSGLAKSDDDKRAALTRAVGIRIAEADEAPSLQETKDLVGLTITVVQAAEKQKMYTPSAEVAEFIEGYNEAVVNGILGVRTRIDPNGNLPPSMRQKIDDHLRLVAAAAHESAENYVESKRAGLQQAGVA